MHKVKKRNIIVASMIIMTMLFASNIGSFAAEDTATESKEARLPFIANLTEVQMEAVHKARMDSVEAAVDSLVDKEILSTEDAEGIVKVKMIAPMVKRECFSGDLTDEQRDAIREKMQNGELAIRGNGINQNLTDEQREALQNAVQANFIAAIASLVDDGTITQEQSEQILDAKNSGPGMFMKGTRFGPGHGKGQGTRTMLNQEI